MVTIVMRTFERPVLLARAVASVQQQSFSDWQLIIVNNGGEPRTVDEVVRIAAQRSTVSNGVITVLHLAERVGMEVASNAGLAATESEYFVIHDDDDSWNSKFLESTVAHLSTHAGDVAVVTGFVKMHETMRGDKVWPEREEEFWLVPGRLTFRGMIGANTFPPIAALFRRRLLDEVGSFDETLPVLGDWEFNLRAVKAGTFGFIPERLARYHVRTSDSDRTAGNSVTVGQDLHRDVKLQLQQRWTNEPAVNGVNKGQMSLSAQAVLEAQEMQQQLDEANRKLDEANRRLQLPWRRVVRSVLDPVHGFRAVMRIVRRLLGK